MTFEQTMHTIYGIFNKAVGYFGNYEVNRFFREIETPLKAMQADYYRLLEENNQLKTDLKAYIKADREKAKAFCGNCSFLQEGLERERNNA